MSNPASAPQFGQLLREHRRRHGLSQAELGGERYSGSYISHLESGRRGATPEVVGFLAQRLGVSPLELGIEPLRGADLAAVDRDTDTMEELLVAERAWHDRDWPAAAAHARRAAASAAAAGQPERHWEALYVQAQARFADADFAGASEIAVRLAEHDVAQRSAALRAQALSLASIAFRASDHLGQAIAFASRAVEVAEGTPPVILAEALMALVSALTEAGLPAGEAEPYRVRLADVALSVESKHARGMIAWALGTAAFRAGDVASGVALHGEAQCLLDPRHDVRLWLRLHRSMANCRLDAGMTDGVAELLQTSRTGLEIIGNNSDVVELRHAEVKLLLLEGRAAEAETEIRRLLGEPALGALDISRGQSTFLLGRAQFALGDRVAAARSFAAAAAELERQGLLKRALEAWRLGSEAMAAVWDLTAT